MRSQTNRRSRQWFGLVVLTFACFALLSGCVKPRPELPGDSEYEVVDVEIEGADEVGVGPLTDGALALRPSGLTAPPQPYNPYRVGEDRRRIRAFYQNRGFYEVEVDGPELDFDEDEKSVSLTWHVTEGPRYTVASVDVVDEPEGYRDSLLDTLPFEAGDDIDMETYRRARFTMSDVLLDDGWMHATIYSRAYIDPETKTVDWRYFVDEGPKTRIGTLEITGNERISDEDILARSGLEVGQPISNEEVRKAELDLLDTGSFHHAHMVSDADVPERVRPLPPETGGIVEPERVDAEGNLVPRELPAELDMELHTGEAPRVTARAGGGGQADLARLDALARGTLVVRDLFAPFHQLVVEGRLGYGFLWRDETDEPLGLYGSALVRYIWAGLLGRIGDFRLTAEFDDRLFPGYHTREVMGGPGVRVAITEDLFFDLDIYARYNFEQPGYGAFDPAALEALELVDESEYVNSELRTSLIWDVRNHRFEPSDGWFTSLAAAFSPGDPLGEHRYVRGELDARYYIPIGSPYTFSYFALAFKALGGWVFGLDDSGVPPTARIYGGGNYGMRGFGRQELSSYAQRCSTRDDGTQDCDTIPVGGLSTVRGTVEARWLPFRQLYGAAVFADVGSVGDDANPFGRGVNLALGAGLRIRVFWYFQLSLDFSYRVLDDERFADDNENIDVSPFQFFVRIGESF